MRPELPYPLIWVQLLFNKAVDGTADFRDLDSSRSGRASVFRKGLGEDGLLARIAGGADIRDVLPVTDIALETGQRIGTHPNNPFSPDIRPLVIAWLSQTGACRDRRTG